MPSHSTSPSQGGSPAPGPWAAPEQHWSRGPARLSEATGHEAKWIVREQRAGDCGWEGPRRSGSCRGRTGRTPGEQRSRWKGVWGLFRSESLRGLAGYGADTAGEESESAAARNSREPRQGARAGRRRAVPPSPHLAGSPAPGPRRPGSGAAGQRPRARAGGGWRACALRPAGRLPRHPRVSSGPGASVSSSQFPDAPKSSSLRTAAMAGLETRSHRAAARSFRSSLGPSFRRCQECPVCRAKPGK